MKRWWWLALLLVAWLSAPLASAHAEGAGFTVTPTLPENQLGGNTGWFNLLVVPGKTQALAVTVANQADTPKRLHLELTNAFTQDNGQVGYAPNTRRDPSATTWLTAMGSKPIDVELAAHTGKPVTFTVTPPAQGFPGQVLGAIYVQDQTPNQTQASGGLAITNEFAMVVAVQLQTSTKQVAPALKLVSVKPSTTKLVAHIQNTRARLFGQLKLTATITPKNQSKAVFTQKNTGYQMAPNSAFDYALTLNKPLAAGDYQLRIAAAAGKYHWVLTRAFHLDADAAAKLAPPPAAPQAQSLWWLAGIGIVAALAVGIWIGRRRKGGG